MTATFKLTLVLARRFMRGRSLARSTLILFAMATFLMGMFITLKAFTLSGSQVVARDYGRFAYVADLGGLATVNPGDADLTQGLHQAAVAAGAADSMTSLTSTDIRLSKIDAPHTPYIEADWASHPYPARYLLTSGRWPTRPNEVVMTRSAILQPFLGEDLSVLAGHIHFTVVGIAVDNYSGAPAILAAPGTWAAMDPRLTEEFPTLEADPDVSWSSADPGRMATAIAGVLARHTKAPPQDIIDGVAASTTNAADAKHRGETTWADRVPAAYTVPSLALPALAMLLIFGLNDRRFRRSLATMTSLGVRRGQAVAAVSAATLAWALVAALAGVVAGSALGLAARPIVRHFQYQPNSPVPGLVAPAARLLLMTLLGTVLAAVLLWASLSPKRKQEATSPAAGTASTSDPHRGRGRDVRHILAAVTACVAVLQVPRLDSTFKAMVFAATAGVAILLVAPDIVEQTLQRLPRHHGPRTRLGRQQLLNDRRRAVIAVVVLAAGLGVPLGFLTLLDTMISTAEAGVYPDVAPHQIALCSGGEQFQPPSPAVLRMVQRDVLPAQPSIQLHYLWSDQQPVLLQGTQVGLILALDTPDQIAALTGRQLSTAQIAALRQGGLLLWADDGQDHHTLITESANHTASTTSPLPTQPLQFPPVLWKASSRGVLLTSTARHLGLPVADGGIFFTGVSDKDAAAAQHAVLNAGLDPKQVLVYKPPTAVIAPAALYAAAVGLLLLLLLTSVTVARGQVSTLKGYLGILIAIGLPTRWARHVLLFEQVVILTVSVGLAIIIAIPPVIVATWRIPGFVLSIPWAWLVPVVLTFTAATLAATIISAQRLRAADRATA